MTIGAVVALGVLVPIASLATDGDELEKSAKQAGEDSWIPSLAITSGVTIQDHKGLVDSVLFEGMDPTPIPLRGFVNGSDTAVSPFVGGALEVMAPALPIPTRPRVFLSGEIIPTFATSRDLALEGDPGCVRGPQPDDPCARNEVPGERRRGFGEDDANGQGSETTAEIDTLVFGANLGVAFPLQFGKRQLRIKPYIAWINYKVEANGLVVDAECDPENRCTDVRISPGFLREATLRGSGSQRFNGIGPGLDVEMDAARYGPLGVSLFIGGRAYAIVDDRTISFDATQSFDDQIGMDTAAARFEVKVDSWIYRAHVGVRFHWLGDHE